MTPNVGDLVTLHGRTGLFRVLGLVAGRDGVTIVPAGECWDRTPRVVSLASVSPAEDPGCTPPSAPTW